MKVRDSQARAPAVDSVMYRSYILYKKNDEALTIVKNINTV